MCSVLEVGGTNLLSLAPWLRAVCKRLCYIWLSEAADILFLSIKAKAFSHHIGKSFIHAWTLIEKNKTWCQIQHSCNGSVLIAGLFSLKLSTSAYKRAVSGREITSQCSQSFLLLRGCWKLCVMSALLYLADINLFLGHLISDSLFHQLVFYSFFRFLLASCSS